MLLTSIRQKAEKALGSEWVDIEPFLVLAALLPPEKEDNTYYTDGVCIAQTLAVDPSLFFTDVSFFLHACEALGSEDGTQFDLLPMPNSIELVSGIVEACAYTGKDITELSDGIKSTILELLKQDGYIKPVWPFDEILDDEDFPPFKGDEISNKSMAAKEAANHEVFNYLKGVTLD